jgi:nitroimidazol reductase NimA-like FMN-containing flavoprotein (pyridoxamine 5'-phosphate oxidase superfamily)
MLSYYFHSYDKGSKIKNLAGGCLIATKIRNRGGGIQIKDG